MRIAFDATSCAKRDPGGIGGYGRNLVLACARVAPEHDYRLAGRPAKWRRRAFLRDLLPGSPRLVMDTWPEATLGALDVYHGLGVRLPRRGRFAKVFMLHDINVFEFPELSDADWRATRSARIRQTLDRADLALVYSEQGADAVVEHLGVEREQLRVVPAGVDVERFTAPDEETVAEAARRHGVTDTRFLLHLGGYGPRKNQRGLLDAFARTGLAEEGWGILFGGPRGDDAKALREAARACGVPPDCLRLPGYLTADDVVALYAAATIVVVPSMHEGFGLPVLEAQACGAPVAASNRGALPETVGDCGVLFDPTDPDDVAAALRRLADDEALRAALATRGPARVRTHFTWDEVARRHLAAFEEAVTRSS